jgi:ketosteroid isomerase-like protein
MKKTLLLPCLLALVITAFSQERKVASTSMELYQTIERQDSLLFDAFNRQDIERMKTFFTSDLEWFQDNGGLIHFEKVFENFDHNFFKANLQLRRDLVPGSLEVHPIQGYGAIEIGSHRFRHMENGREQVGVFKFLMIWQQKDGHWQISRVVSYDH